MQLKGDVYRMIHTVAWGMLGCNWFFLLGCTSSARSWAGWRKCKPSQNETPSGYHLTLLHPCQHKLKNSLSRADYTAATKLVGWPDNHLEVFLEMALPLLSWRWWLLIFIALKQHESKTAATQNKYKQNKMIFTEQVTI